MARQMVEVSLMMLIAGPGWMVPRHRTPKGNKDCIHTSLTLLRRGVVSLVYQCHISGLYVNAPGAGLGTTPHNSVS